ncbi:MAG: hypothetical protein GY941_22145 [Planctomycetes bacterium]|nr:hypothetical protein [Planctomycetota bacterium]
MHQDQSLVKEIWAEGIKMTLKTAPDIYALGMADTVAQFSQSGVSFPTDGIGMKLTAGQSNFKQTFAVANPLTGRPLAGNAGLLGNEKTQSMRNFNCYYNEQKDGVVVETRGIDYNYNNAFGLYEQATPQLTKYWKETIGRQKRQCVLEWYNEEIFVNNPAPLPMSDTHWNPNWIINGDTSAAGAAVDDNGMPIWNSTKATFEEALGDAIMAGAAAAVTAGTEATIAFFNKVGYLAEDMLLEPLDSGKYVLTVPTPVWHNIIDLDNTKGFAAYFKEVKRFNGTDLEGVDIKMYEYNNLLIVPDNRWVGLEVTGADGSWGLSPTYVEPGREDDRNKKAFDATTNKAVQLGQLLGKNAFIERMEKELYFKQDVQNYEQLKGMGTFMECGFNLTVIRDDRETGTAGYPDVPECIGSAIVVWPGQLVGA